MSLGLILLIVLILMLLGVLPTWGHSRNWGYGPSGGLGLVLAVVGVLHVADARRIGLDAQLPVHLLDQLGQSLQEPARRVGGASGQVEAEQDGRRLGQPQ